MRRFFSIYFIPLIPLNRNGSYIECIQCRAKLDSSVLQYDPHKTEEDMKLKLTLACKQAMYSVCITSGPLEPLQIDTICHYLHRTSATQGSVEMVQSEIATMSYTPENALLYLSQLQSELSVIGKESLLKAATAVAQTYSSLSPVTANHLHSIAQALKISSSSQQAILPTAISEA